MNIIVRSAIAEDLSSLLALYGELNPDDAPLPQQAAHGIWAGIHKQQGRTVLVAEVDGVVVGTADCIVLPNLTRGGRAILFVENVVVASSVQRQGVGQRLMEAAVQLGKTAGCYKAQLLAAEDEYVHTFYEACGFKPLAQGFRRYLRAERTSATVA
ncbi:GNAT family N-acetyltransferase [Streptomyces sp. NPDC127097]|uniref:GNAT family N-acetyltransferase n=1 Tax=Streptomyces sp. NPDC127097 TaxID=3347136 RepID=UPI003660360C